MSVLQVWTHTDEDAVCFRTTQKGGPKRSTVVFRRSFDEDTGELLEETLDPQHTPKWKLYRRIPGGPCHLRTELAWEDNELNCRPSEPADVQEPNPDLSALVEVLDQAAVAASPSPSTPLDPPQAVSLELKQKKMPWMRT